MDQTETLKTSISWKCKHTWRRASVNTLWCLLGCSIGDFGTIYFFQVTQNPWSFSVLNIMILAIINGLITSIMLETFILSKQMKLQEAFKTAIGMSLVSMISMEVAMNVVDVLLTCLLYTSDAADEEDSVGLGGRRIINKKKQVFFKLHSD